MGGLRIRAAGEWARASKQPLKQQLPARSLGQVGPVTAIVHGGLPWLHDVTTRAGLWASDCHWKGLLFTCTSSP